MKDKEEEKENKAKKPVAGNDYYSKYIKPQLKVITEWSKKGLTDSEIAKGLEISYSTFLRYKKMDEGFREAVTTGVEYNVKRVEAALLKRAIGESKITRHKYSNVTIMCTDSDGREYEQTKMVPVETIVEELPPDVQACKIYLTAKKAEEYSEKRQLEIAGNKDKPIVKEIKINLGGVSLPSDEEIEAEKRRGALTEEELAMIQDEE